MSVCSSVWEPASHGAPSVPSLLVLTPSHGLPHTVPGLVCVANRIQRKCYVILRLGCKRLSFPPGTLSLFFFFFFFYHLLCGGRQLPHHENACAAHGRYPWKEQRCPHDSPGHKGSRKWIFRPQVTAAPAHGFPATSRETLSQNTQLRGSWICNTWYDRDDLLWDMDYYFKLLNLGVICYTDN